MKVLEKIIARRSALCIKILSDPITFLIMMLIFLDFRAQKLPLIFFTSPEPKAPGELIV